MKGSLVCLLFLSLAMSAFAEWGLTPRPAREIPAEGTCLVKAGQFVFQRGGPQASLADLNEAAGFRLRPAPADAPCVIQFLSADMLAATAGVKRPQGEGYVIWIRPKAINAYAATANGHFYARQSIIQLLQRAQKVEDGQSLEVRCGVIADRPRFAWRGFMLDESRHFTGVEGVKRLLDAMARYKLNRLHLHLTDSPAWRIEIKAYPKLTAVGGRGSQSDQSPDAQVQFYTQEEIRELVSYGRARGITLIPEIDMPGHADAAVRAYPEHSGGGNKKWPHFTFNPAKKETREFLETILGEVKDLFPDAGLIHFGGDEAHFGWGKWLELPEVKALMKEQNFSERGQVERWFNLQMAKSIKELGFTVGGWDEIADKGLDPRNSLVFWWRHDKPEVLHKALDQAYEIVLCPRRPMYLDFVQDDSHQVGRRWSGFNPLDDVYQFPDGLGLSARNFQQIRGIQACLWTEQTLSQARRDFMTWPRLVAVAEAAWTPQAQKDFDHFVGRLPAEIDWLKMQGIECWDYFARSPEVGR